MKDQGKPLDEPELAHVEILGKGRFADLAAALPPSGLDADRFPRVSGHRFVWLRQLATGAAQWTRNLALENIAHR